MPRARTDAGLGLRLVVERAATEFPDRRVVTRSGSGSSALNYHGMGERVRSLASALDELGVGPGDRVVSLAWNSHRHLELVFAVSCLGAVSDVVNIRFQREETARLIAAAAPSALFVDATLLECAPALGSGLLVVVMPDADADADGAVRGALRYEELLESGDPSFELPVLDELLPATICYTSSTTGEPKAVQYTHRSLVLGALVLNQPGVAPLRESDRVLPAVPLFHANAWSFPFAAMLSGAELVLAGPHPSAADLARLIEDERVTKAAGVPTVFADLLDVAGADLSSLDEIYCAGMPPPERLVRAYRERFAAEVVHAWGMTETGVFGLVSRPPAPPTTGDDAAAELASAQGRAVPLLAQRIAEGGELQVRGPAVAGSYADGSGAESYTDDGWLRTGDVAVALGERFVRIVDRVGDTIKSGGEWIHSLALEALMRDFEGIADVAIVAARDERWGERPFGFVVMQPDAVLDLGRLHDFLAGRVPRWWIPDAVQPIDALPRSGNGKVDKRALRALLHDESRAPGLPLGRRALQPLVPRP